MTTDLSPRTANLYALLDGLLDPFFAVDAHWRFTFVNHHAAAIMGTTPPVLLGRVLWECFPEALSTALHPHYHAVMNTREVAEFDAHYPALGVWVEVRAFPHDDGIAVHFRDITERRLADERRERLLDVTRALAGAPSTWAVAEAALRTGLPALEASGGAVLVPGADSLTVLHSLGAAVGEDAALPPETLAPATRAFRAGAPVFLRAADLNALDPELEGARAVAALPLVVNAQTLGVLLLQFSTDRTFNEAERDFAASLAGQLAQALARAQLSDEREATLAALKVERERLALILAQMPVAIWVAEVPSGRLITGNDAIGRILRRDFLPAGGIDEYSEYMGFHPDGRRYEGLDWPLARTVTTGQTVENEEVEMLRGDGTRGYVSYSSALIHDVDGTPAFAVVTGVDVTARHEAEAALRDLNEELEARVRARTHELEAAARALQDANQELEAFSYSVSHDLRTPLRHIQGFVGLLRRQLSDTLSPRAATHLDVIESSAARMNTLIEELLAFARASRATMQRQAVPLGQLVEEVRANLAPEQQGRTVHWTVGSLPTVQGDQAMLRQVFVNLLSNALKYTRTREEARIEVRAELDAGMWTVSVRDNGVGFDPQYADRLFGAFQRLHREDEFEGVGVGLANVRRVVARHEGRTGAEGRLGEGATFWFSLPA
ncbi:ATP-binding protein [Deinococcus maricopensis]|uniref:histidine kinase n=1 Tax=Deinococcus maricopensis (strain DSM 21211 / LMG 22137 / NRRL B-23946 / LB-34) TaxID=709986 RepID=E8U7P5_DEIML|nr:ATP-binding protein [Deinococcus maricopensis]ADV67084.1 multi-sensor signal transduction histidine kinase [Deinococcus maricopensis DSM 21211]